MPFGRNVLLFGDDAPAVTAMLSNVTFTIVALYVGLAVFTDLNVSLSMILGYFLFRLQY